MKKKLNIYIALTAITLILLNGSFASAESKNNPNNNAKGYWDDKNLNDAVAIELVIDEKTKVGKIEKLAKRGGGTSNTSNSGASWTKGGLPLTATGKVFFTMGAGKYVCSAALVSENDSERAIVLTAGHCAYDFVTGLATNWMFYPNYDSNPNSTCSIGRCFYASSLIVQPEFISAGSFNTQAVQHDWAFAVIKKSVQNGDNLPDTFPSNPNSFELNENGFTKVSDVSYAFGYPAASPYNGNDLVYANGPIGTDSLTSNSTWSMNSNLTGGSSGGTWLSGFNTSTNVGKLSSLNSYKYGRDKTKMYGPKFNSKTRELFNLTLVN